MSVIYAQASAPAATYRISGPEVLAPDGRGLAAVRQAIQAAARAAGQQGQRRAVAAYSPPAIKAGWALHTTTSPAIRITVENPVPLLLWVEEPTRPHVIQARFKRALAWSGGAHPVKAVQHPGTPGKHRIPGLAAELGRLFEAQLDKRVTPLLGGDVFSVAGGFEAFT